MSALAAKRGKKLDGNLMTSQVFAQMFHAYLECNDEVQSAIRDMVEIVNAPDATEDEKEAATLTIAEALFPSHQNGAFGADLEDCDSTAPEDIKGLLHEMDDQEAAFSERVTAILADRSMTQSELASLSGVGQPAISMMLSRKCRPQRRTVERIAKALGVQPNDLWSEIESE